MKTIAFATLQRPAARPRQCHVELVELELPAPAGGDPQARYIVTVRQGELKGGVLLEAAESSLTAVPCRRAEAERRALDFLRRRLAAGELLVRSEGFGGLDSPPPAQPATAAPAAASAAPASPAIQALVGRFHPDRWRLLPASKQARSAWRVGEYSDPAATGSASQHMLVALVPRLISLLESGADLLDLCLAVAIGRLGDPGAAQAMHSLSERGRSPATRRAARQAWLLLDTSGARQDVIDGLLADPVWQPALRGELSVEQLETILAERRLGWTALLCEWYDIALVRPEAHAALLALSGKLPLRAGVFQAVRRIYKAAEQRRDAALLGVLHARFENTPANFYNHGVPARGFMSPLTGRWVARPPREELARPEASLAYGSRTRNYLRLRGWRHLRRLAAIGHSQAPVLAVQLLLGLEDDDLPAARQEARWEHINGRYTRTDRHYHPASGWLLVQRLLLARHADVKIGARATRWHSRQPLLTDSAMETRTEGLPELWDRHPEALLALALRSRAALVHAVVARALQDHLPFLESQPATLLKTLLQSGYAPTARIAFEAVRARVLRSGVTPDQLMWLALLVHSNDKAARDFALLHIASDPAAYAQHSTLVAAMLLAPAVEARRQGAGLAALAPPAALVAELQGALLALETSPPGLGDTMRDLERLLQATLATAAREAPVEPLLCLLDHPSAEVLGLAVSWLLWHGHGVAMVPASTLARLLGDTVPERRASGVRLLAALPDHVLHTQVALLCDLAVHPHAAIRTAIRPALERLSADTGFAHALAARLHAVLFAAEAGEGVHDDALQLLTGPLAAEAPARDTSGTWRALQARSSGAQRYGTWALMSLPAPDFSLRQLATLARHADASVRCWAMNAIDEVLGALPGPDQVADLLPLGDSLFDDARAYAARLFGERLGDDALTPELLITWIDHPQPWMQSLGRSRLVRRMDAGEASLCLTRLSQHPSIQVQLFITQWLLELPRHNPAELAERLRMLKPYFVTVLSQVHRGRTAKSRVTDFLRSVADHADTASVVAEIFARQVVTSSLTDKPAYIAGLRDIAARHPQIELPFVAWKPTEPRHRATR
jgi:hypothetical protein